MLRGPRGRAALAVVLAFAAGARIHAERLDAAARFAPASPFEATLELTVEDVWRGPSGVSIDAVHVQHAGPNPRPVPERLRIIAEPGEGDAFENALPGDRHRVRVVLGPWLEHRNPGSRSRQRQAERAGVGAVARLVHPALHVRRPDAEGFRPLHFLYATRARIGQRLANSGRGGSLVRALALGDRSGLTPETRAAFAALGLAHLIAVSGLHLALVASLVYAAHRIALARCAWLAARCDTRQLALVAAGLAAVTYALVAGWGVPVRRALVLFGGLTVGVLRGRFSARAEPLAGAAMLVLTFEPQALFDPGAQLSFTATAALVVGVRAAPGQAGRWRGFDTGIRASATALSVTAPIAAVHFGQVAPAALLANVIAVPWTALVLLPGSLLAAVVAGLPPHPVGAAIGSLVSGVAAASLSAAEVVAAWIPQAGPRACPAPAWLAAASALGGVTLLARSTSTRAGLALASGALLAAAPPAARLPALPRLVVLDVGQGDAILMQAQGAALLVDAGTARPGGTDMGLRQVLPALAALDVRRLDLVIATHPDLDHRGGLPAVLDALPVGAVWVPYGSRDDPGFASVRAVAARRGVPVRERGWGSPPLQRGDLRVTPVWPPPSAPGLSRNDRSLVVRVDVAGRRILLAGDVESLAELALLASGADLRADVLALPHHGSRTSSSRALLQRVAAQLAVASAPCRGRFGMPHPEVLARAADAHLSVWWTGRDGAVMVGLAEPLVAWGYGKTLSCRDPPGDP